MKIVAISDIHGYLPELPECDVVTISGDIIPLHIQRNYEESIAWLSGPFQTWALNLPCKKVILIAGNHDFVFERLWKNVDLSSNWTMHRDSQQITNILFQQDDYDNKIVYLQDSAYKYEGKTFYGTPWCPNLRNWAFYGTSDELSSRFNNIPYNTDVLLTHCPPKFGTQGKVLQKNNWNLGKDFGCDELQKTIETTFAFKENNTWVVSGHIHSGNHKVEHNWMVKYVNVSIKDEDYEPTYKYFEFEI